MDFETQGSEFDSPGSEGQDEYCIDNLKEIEMGFFICFFNPLLKYAEFEGRARRKEFWIYYLGIIVIEFVLVAVISLCMARYGTMDHVEYLEFVDKTVLLISILVALPTWAVSVRRLHDIGRSGWNVLLYFVPVVGQLYLLYLFLKSGDPFDNKYGADPIWEEIS